MRLIEVLYARHLNPQTEEPEKHVYKIDPILYSELMDDYTRHELEIVAAIEKYSKRSIDDIKNIEYVVLAVALSESYFSETTPYKVAIDEAIELARDYSDNTSASFVAGVLGAAFEDKFKSNN